MSLDLGRISNGLRAGKRRHARRKEQLYISGTAWNIVDGTNWKLQLGVSVLGPYVDWEKAIILQTRNAREELDRSRDRERVQKARLLRSLTSSARSPARSFIAIFTCGPLLLCRCSRSHAGGFGGQCDRSPVLRPHTYSLTRSSLHLNC